MKTDIKNSTKSESKKDFKFIISNTHHEWYGLLLVSLIRVVGVLCSFTHPKIKSLIIDCGLNFQPDQDISATGFFKWLISGVFGDRGTLQLIIYLSIFFTATILISDLSKNLLAYFQAKYRVKVRERLIRKSYNKFCSCNSSISNSEALNLIKDDITGVGEVSYTNIPSIILDVVTMILAITTLSNINYLLLIVPILAAPPLLYYSIVYIKKLYQAQLTVREQKVQLNETTKENIEGIKSIKLFNISYLSKQRFKKKNTKYVTALIEKNQLSNTYSLIFNIIKKTAYIISIVVGGILAIYRYISIGEFLTFTTFVVSLLDSITSIVSDVATTQINMTTVRKSRLFLEQPDDITEATNPVVLDTNTTYDLTLNQVNLTLNDKKVLQNVSFSLPKGKSLGVIGGSGDGKSALIKTMMRVLPATSGSILIGEDIVENLSIKNMRDIYSYHMQNPTLFNMSIRDNLLFSGIDCSDERITTVVDTLNCDPLFSKIPNGYEYEITDNGIGFGQYKNRLCLARTILKDSPIYIFDDIFTSFDESDSKNICKNIIKLLPDKTTIFLSNNYDNVKHCDYILKLKKGKVSYFGDSASYNKINKAGGFHE